MTRTSTEDLLRQLAPQVLGAVVRRYGDFSGAEDAVQEALLIAATTWPAEGLPDNPAAWLTRAASRRLVDQYRRDDARRRREDLAASWSMTPYEPEPSGDDTLILMFMCCHPSLTPAAAIPLTLRAVGGLTTREIAAAFLVPEATMAQRISRAVRPSPRAGRRGEVRHRRVPGRGGPHHEPPRAALPHHQGRPPRDRGRCGTGRAMSLDRRDGQQR